MVDKDIVLRKAESIRRCLERIGETTGGNPDALDNADKQDIFVLNLQRAAQAAIDLASHLVAEEGWELPDTLRDLFGVLATQGVIDAGLAGHLARMASFRNLAVHDYQELDHAVLANILTHRLEDLRDFRAAVLRWADRV